MMRVSVCSANKFYTTHLFCCKDSYNFFIKNNIPFTEITILDELSELPNGENSLWSWSKIVTMKYQDEPWLHLDFDSILTKPFGDFTEDVVFGFPDYYVDDMNVLSASGVSHLTDIYLYWFYQLHNTNTHSHEWDFKQIPNASFIYCKSPNEIKKVITKFESDNKWILDTYVNNSDDDRIGELCCYFEQFLFTKYIRDFKLKTLIRNIDGYNNASVDSKSDFENDYQFIINYMNNGYFHFPLYKLLSNKTLDKIYLYFWEYFKINELRKFKIDIL